MLAAFPRVRRSRRGYDVEQVEDFLRRARDAFEAPDPGPGVLTADAIRHTAFDLRRRGFETGAVDAALERLEDAFAEREGDTEAATLGPDAAIQRCRPLTREILNRLRRPSGHRAARAGLLGYGYHRGEVDRFLDRVDGYFADRRPMDVETVRRVTFHPQRHGYREAQVDLLLDGVVEVMLALR